MSKILPGIYIIGTLALLVLIANPTNNSVSPQLSPDAQQHTEWFQKSSDVDIIIKGASWGIGTVAILMIISTSVVNYFDIKDKNFDNDKIINKKSPHLTTTTQYGTQATFIHDLEEKANPKGVTCLAIQSEESKKSLSIDLEMTEITYANIMAIAKHKSTPLSTLLSHNAMQLLQIYGPVTGQSIMNGIALLDDPNKRARSVLRVIIEDKIYDILNNKFIDAPLDLIIGGVGIHAIVFFDEPIVNNDFYSKYANRHYFSIGNTHFEIPQKRLSMLSYHNAVKKLGNKFFDYYPKNYFDPIVARKFHEKIDNQKLLNQFIYSRHTSETIHHFVDFLIQGITQ